MNQKQKSWERNMATSDLLSASRENGLSKFVPVLSPTSRNFRKRQLLFERARSLSKQC